MGPSEFGKRLKEARVRAGMTQGQLAVAAEIPRHMTISDYERGVRRLPQSDTLERLADALGVSIKWLLSGETEQQPVPPSHPVLEEFLGSPLAADITDAEKKALAGIAFDGQPTVKAYMFALMMLREVK